MRLYAYKLGSVTARALAKGLGTFIVRPDGDFKNSRLQHKVINWGSTLLPNWRYGDNTFLNHPRNVANAVNKLVALHMLMEAKVPTVEFTVDKSVALNWLSESPVVVRKIINSSQGKGIEIVEQDDLPNAPLYTKFIPKAREYRIHVCNGKVIDLQQKRRRAELEDTPSGLIKNLANGWVYCHDEITPLPEGAEEVAIKAVQALGLDFGSVDMLTKKGQVYVLEVNSASGLEGLTLEKYINEFKKYATE